MMIHMQNIFGKRARFFTAQLRGFREGLPTGNFPGRTIFRLMGLGVGLMAQTGAQASRNATTTMVISSTTPSSSVIHRFRADLASASHASSGE